MNKFAKEVTTEKDIEFVEFLVGTHHFGISISQVREIIEPMPVTIIPHAPNFVKGIIQLRGEVLPLIDLKEMAGISMQENEKETKYIVVEFEETVVALEVSDVVQINRIRQQEIESAQDIYVAEDLPVYGVIKENDRMTLLVDFPEIIQERLN